MSTPNPSTTVPAGMPAITSGSAAAQPAAPSGKQKRTKLHAAAEQFWGLPPGAMFDDDDFFYLTKYINPDAIQPTKTGFQIGPVKWEAPTNKSPEMITGSAQGFNQATADAMVAMARLHGWKNLNLHGTDEQKAMLWMAIQRQNLMEEAEYNKHPQLDANGQKIPFEPLTTPFMPPANVLSLWQAEEAKLKAKMNAPAPAPIAQPAPAAPPPAAAPTAAAPTAAAPTAAAPTAAAPTATAPVPPVAKSTTAAPAQSKTSDPSDVDIDAMDIAIHTGEISTVRHLLGQGFPANFQLSGPGKDYLVHRAALKGQKEILELLVSKKADLQAKNGLGETALHSAAFGGNKDTIEALVKSGLDINAKNNAGKTPLDIAREEKQQSAIDFLESLQQQPTAAPPPKKAGGGPAGGP